MAAVTQPSSKQAWGWILLRWLYTALTVLPWLVVAFYVILITNALLQFGRWPVQYDPNVSTLLAAPLLLPVTSYLMFLLIVSWPLWALMTALIVFKGLRLLVSRTRVLFYVTGFALFVVFSDIGGIAAWIWD